MTLSSDNIGPSEGPMSFDYVVDFTTHFPYDPSAGNLIVDFLTRGAGGDVLFDSTSGSLGGVSYRASDNRNAIIAQYQGTSSPIFAFTFVPKPSTFALGAVGLLGLFAQRRRLRQLI